MFCLDEIDSSESEYRASIAVHGMLTPLAGILFLLPIVMQTDIMISMCKLIHCPSNCYGYVAIAAINNSVICQIIKLAHSQKVRLNCSERTSIHFGHWETYDTAKKS